MACNSGLLELYHFFAITVCLDSGSNSSWVELTALAAMCAQLTGPNSTEVQVSEPIHISIPLPSDSPLKTATSVPVWRFEHKTGKQHLTKIWLSLNNSTQIDDFIQKWLLTGLKLETLSVWSGGWSRASILITPCYIHPFPDLDSIVV